MLSIALGTYMGSLIELSIWVSAFTWAQVVEGFCTVRGHIAEFMDAPVKEPMS